jgi:hypothetical protein
LAAHALVAQIGVPSATEQKTTLTDVVQEQPVFGAVTTPDHLQRDRIVLKANRLPKRVRWLVIDQHLHRDPPPGRPDLPDEHVHRRPPYHGSAVLAVNKSGLTVKFTGAPQQAFALAKHDS